MKFPGSHRSILLAGASTVVSSLWQVSDESTAMLMHEFHSGLAAGEASDRALRRAALAVRKKYPQPFYWRPSLLQALTNQTDYERNPCYALYSF